MSEILWQLLWFLLGAVGILLMGFLGVMLFAFCFMINDPNFKVDDKKEGD